MITRLERMNIILRFNMIIDQLLTILLQHIVDKIKYNCNLDLDVYRLVARVQVNNIVKFQVW